MSCVLRLFVFMEHQSAARCSHEEPFTPSIRFSGASVPHVTMETIPVCDLGRGQQL